jgi:hypothetical protein
METDEMAEGVELAAPPIGDRPKRVRLTATAIDLIEQICLEEGATVTLTGPNPDNNGLPNEAVTVCNDDTSWQDRIFRRDTVEEALQAAIDYRGDDPEGARDLIRAMADHLDGALGASERKVSDSHALWIRAQRFLGEQP